MSPEHRPHVDPSDDCWCRGPWAHDTVTGPGDVAPSVPTMSKWITELPDGTLINHRGETIMPKGDPHAECYRLGYCVVNGERDAAL